MKLFNGRSVPWRIYPESVCSSFPAPLSPSNTWVSLSTNPRLPPCPMYRVDNSQHSSSYVSLKRWHITWWLLYSNHSMTPYLIKLKVKVLIMTSKALNELLPHYLLELKPHLLFLPSKLTMFHPPSPLHSSSTLFLNTSFSARCPRQPHFTLHHSPPPPSFSALFDSRAVTYNSY